MSVRHLQAVLDDYTARGSDEADLLRHKGVGELNELSANTLVGPPVGVAIVEVELDDLGVRHLVEPDKIRNEGLQPFRVVPDRCRLVRPKRELFGVVIEVQLPVVQLKAVSHASLDGHDLALEVAVVVLSTLPVPLLGLELGFELSDFLF